MSARKVKGAYFLCWTMWGEAGGGSLGPDVEVRGPSLGAPILQHLRIPYL